MYNLIDTYYHSKHKTKIKRKQMAITTKPKQFLLLLIQKFQTFFSLGLVFLLSILVLGYSLFSGFYQINTDLFPAKDALAAVNCPAQFTWNGTNCIQTVQKLPVCDRGGVLVSNNCVPDYQSAQGIKTANCRLGLNLSTSNACFQFNPDSGVVDRAVFGYPTVCGQYNVTQSDINLIYAGRSGLDFLTNNFSPSPIQYYLADHADGQYCLNPVTFNYPFLPTVNFQSCNFIPGQINIGTNSRISCENGNLVFQATNAGVGAGNTSIYSTMLLDSRPTASGTAKKLECLNVGFQAVNSCKLLEKTLNSATPKVPGTTVQLGNVKNLFIDKVGYDSNLTYQNTGGCPAGFSDTPGGGGLSCQKITAPIGQSVDSTDIDLATSSVCSQIGRAHV